MYILTAAAMTACVNDLNTLPLNKTEPVSENVYGNSEEAYLQGLSRLYFQFVTNDLTDLQNIWPHLWSSPERSRTRV